MIKEAWRQITENQDVRQNLSRLRQGVKERENLNWLTALVNGGEEAGGKRTLSSLLLSEDAKTRKNAALLMGDLGIREFLAPVFDAYLKEEQRFVKSSYLVAVGKFDYKEYLPKLRERLEQLSKEEITEENRKHLMEETRELSALIVRAEGVKTHPFTGWKAPYDIVLLTNRNFPDYTWRELLALEPGAKAEIFGAGVRARVENLTWIDQIRTYQELLFVVKGMGNAPMDDGVMAETVVRSELLPWLSEIHKGEPPFYFRVEMKSKKPLDEKSAFVKKLSGQIERLSKRRLINAASDYELELRIIENKEGSCNLLVKLFTLKDERFAYRREVIPTSIRPVNAALTVALAREYLTENAQVLDPFCGVGTMLTERHKAVRIGTAYGLDIQEDAIVKARKNAEAAGQMIYYINRDFFRFEHDYLFDEVMTDMPFKIGRITEEEVEEIYWRFFDKVSEFLKPDALVVLYSHNRELVERLAPRSGLTLFRKFEISKKEGTYVYLLRKGRLS